MASGGTGSALPDDVAAEQVQRLSAFALVAGGLWAMGLVMDSVVFPLALGATVPRAALVIEALGIAGAIATYTWVRYSHQSLHVKSDAGPWLMMLNAADIALLETWATNPTTATVGHLSWVAIVILLSAMIVPSTPRKMLLAALASASFGPIGVWLAHLRGVDTPSPLLTILMYFPAYSCAVAAVVPARMFEKFGRRLREARDLGSYELEERLGEGGMGEVWRARHRLLARPAAIKLVRPAMLGGGDDDATRLALRRFESEAQATAALTSPHTIRLFDYGATDDGRFYYVMELLAGRDMESLVEASGPLPAPRALHLLRQVCHSLAEAHAQGMVHRDIKPANIFVCRMGLDFDVVKVLDFGLVQVATREPGQDLTASLTSLAALDGIVGTPAFMAPELVADAGSGRPARRHLRAGLRGLLPAHRPARLPRTHAASGAGRSRRHAARASVRAGRPRRAGLARQSGARVPGQGSGRPAAHRGGDPATDRHGGGRAEVDPGAGPRLVAAPPAGAGWSRGGGVRADGRPLTASGGVRCRSTLSSGRRGVSPRSVTSARIHRSDEHSDSWPRSPAPPGCSSGPRRK